MKKRIYMLIGILLYACGGNDESGVKDWNHPFNIGNLQLTDYGFEAIVDGTVRVFGEGFMEEDQIVLISISENSRYAIPLLKVSAEYALFELPKSIVPGRYCLLYFGTERRMNWARLMCGCCHNGRTFQTSREWISKDMCVVGKNRLQGWW